MRTAAPKSFDIIGKHQIKLYPMTFAGLEGRRGIGMH